MSEGPLSARRGGGTTRPDFFWVAYFTLTPATEAELLRLKECGENKLLLSRCALRRSSAALEAIIVLQ